MREELPALPVLAFAQTVQGNRGKVGGRDAGRAPPQPTRMKSWVDAPGVGGRKGGRAP